MLAHWPVCWVEMQNWDLSVFPINPVYYKCVYREPIALNICSFLFNQRTGRPNYLYLFFLSVNIGMNNKRRKEASRRKVQVSVFSVLRLFLFLSNSFIILQFEKDTDWSLVLYVSKPHGFEGAQNGVKHWIIYLVFFCIQSYFKSQNNNMFVWRVNSLMAD